MNFDTSLETPRASDPSVSDFAPNAAPGNPDFDAAPVAGQASSASTGPASSGSTLTRAESPHLLDLSNLVQLISSEIRAEIASPSGNVDNLAQRIAAEIDRISQRSGRIAEEGRSEQLSLARHRLQKCLTYYHHGSKRGRVELHSTLGSMVYRHVAPTRLQLGFQARYSMIEDFLQGFYTESLKAFRRENELPETFQPRSRLELAEYMAFTEHYAKRRITLPGGHSQQLVVLRAQRFGQRQPQEMAVDIEQALGGGGKGEEAEAQNRNPIAQQLRERTVSDSVDLSEAVLRDRVLSQLVDYLKEQDQQDCIDYLCLKMQDLSAPEIDDVLGITPRERDYLQQRFKYHVEKFTLSTNWKLVHQWLGADIDQNLGLSTQQWHIFLDQLTPEQRHLLEMKRSQASDADIIKALKCTAKQLQKRWERILTLARQTRNQN
jgi:hypothetical protein